jgi:hypothetical protein
MHHDDAAAYGGQPTDAYDLTLTGIADELVREELAHLDRYETSDGRTYRVSGADLADLRLAMVERCGEGRAHAGNLLWAERRVYAHTTAAVVAPSSGAMPPPAAPLMGHAS